MRRRSFLAGIGALAALGSVGTIAAIELRAEDAGYLSSLRSRLYQRFIDAGILLRPLGNVVYTVPPYVIRPDDLHYLYDVIGRVLDRF